MAEHLSLFVHRGSALSRLQFRLSRQPKELVGCEIRRILCSAQPMSTAREKLGIVFWVIPLCLQPLIALAIVLRRLTRHVQIFFAYTLLVSARDLVLLFVKHDMRIYAWIYWLSEPLAFVLGVAAIYEVLWQLVRPYDTLRSAGVRLFCGSVAVAVLAGLLMLRTS